MFYFLNLLPVADVISKVGTDHVPMEQLTFQFWLQLLMPDLNSE